MTGSHAGMPAGVESLRRLIGEESESAEEQQGQVGTTSRHAFIVASPVSDRQPGCLSVTNVTTWLSSYLHIHQEAA